jgi:hypothetical protein
MREWSDGHPFRLQFAGTETVLEGIGRADQLWIGRKTPRAHLGRFIRWRATSWTARVEVPAAGMPLNLSWSALADGRRIGSGLLRQKGDTFEMGGVFTGATTTPTFSAQVYNNGQLVGAVGGQPPDVRLFVPVSICTWVPEQCRIAIEFQTLDDGACMVRIVGSRAVPIRLPNGAVAMGNELRLVEEVRPAGHYPYLGFDTMTMRSDTPSFAILSESLR